MLYLEHVTLVTPDEIIADGAMLIQDGRIAALGSADQVAAPSSAYQLDVQGLILSPGFIDLQCNGGFGYDFTENPESLWQVAAGLVRYGVTSFMPTVVTSPLQDVQRALDFWRSEPPRGLNGAIPLGFHLEGPFLNPEKKGAHNPDYILTPSLDAVQNWSLENGVRLVTLAPELPGALDLVRVLKQRGVVVSAGHSTATFEQAQAGFQAGITWGTHLFNAMPALGHRQPALPGALLITPQVIVGMIVDGVHVHPAMVDLAWRALGPQRLSLVTDAMAALGMPPGVYNLAGYQVTVRDGNVRLPDGTLAGSILTMDAALRNLVTFTGCSFVDALPTVTSTPARLLGLESKGHLQIGMDADLVLLDGAGQIQATIVAGQVVYCQPDSFLSLEVGVQ